MVPVPKPTAEDGEPVTGAAVEAAAGVAAGVAAWVAADTTGASAPTAGARAFVAVDTVGADTPVTGARAFATADVAGTVAAGPAELAVVEEFGDDAPVLVAGAEPVAAVGMAVAAALGALELALAEEITADVPVLVAGASAFVAVVTTAPTTPVPGAAEVAAAEVERFAWVEVAGEAAWLADCDPASALGVVAVVAGGGVGFADAEDWAGATAGAGGWASAEN